MAYRLRRRTRRSTLRRRRPMRRRTMMRRRPRLSSLKVHHFKRTFQATDIAGLAGADVLGAYTFRLDQLPNYTEFTNLFDAYRMNKIVIKFVPTANSSSVGSSLTDPLTQFHTVLDFDDATAPASLNAMYEYGNWRMSRGSVIHTRVFTPAVSLALLDGAGTTTGAQKYKQWISTTQPDVLHYGLKYCAAGQINNNDIIWRPYISVYFSCKSTK